MLRKFWKLLMGMKECCRNSFIDTYNLMEARKRELELQIPVINFDGDMDVQITPPFEGATARMRVNGYSVLLDMEYHYNIERYVWEIYDGKECHQFDIDDTKGLIDFVRTLPKRENAL